MEACVGSGKDGVDVYKRQRRAFLGFTAATAALAGVGASAIAFAGEGLSLIHI